MTSRKSRVYKSKRLMNMNLIQDGKEVDLSEYLDFDDVRKQIGCFIDGIYMTKRIHSALGYLIPSEFDAAWRLTPPGQTIL